MANPLNLGGSVGWAAFYVLAFPAQLILNRFRSKAEAAPNVQSAAGDVFSGAAKIEMPAASTALALRAPQKLSQMASNSGVATVAARTMSSAVPPLAVGGAGYAAGTGAAEGMMSAAYTAASSAAGTAYTAASGAAESAFSAAGGAAKYLWSSLSYSTQFTLGTIGVLGLVYLFDKYCSTKTQTQTQKQVFKLNFVGIAPGTEIVKTEGKDGSVKITVRQNKKLVEVVRRVMAENRANKALAAATVA